MARYFCKKVELDGITFDSEMESKYYLLLKERVQKGEVSHLAIHRKYVLIPNFKYDGTNIKGLTYEADFVYFDHTDNRLYIEDVKGFAENEFKQQWKLLQYKIHLLFEDDDPFDNNPNEVEDYFDFILTKDISELTQKYKTLPVFRIIKYSKATGFVELKDYKKAMASAKARAIIEKNEAIKEKEQMKKDLLTIKTLKAKEAPRTKRQDEKLKKLSKEYEDII